MFRFLRLGDESDRVTPGIGVETKYFESIKFKGARMGATVEIFHFSHKEGGGGGSMFVNLPPPTQENSCRIILVKEDKNPQLLEQVS